ncbi:MAG: hypothetical protein MZV64_02850 [Ignavibacteriales bacterium]|nr:hypothetical protein [Ignavibacteriales bacterium]
MAKGIPQKEIDKNKRHPYSATHLQTVCAQAIKNSHYLSLFDTFKPKKIKKWDDPWKDGEVIGKVSKRFCE